LKNPGYSPAVILLQVSRKDKRKVKKKSGWVCAKKITRYFFRFRLCT